MGKIRDFARWLSIDAGQQHIAQAQYNELRTQIPSLYALLMVNAIAVAYTHYDVAPVYLTIGALIPMILITSVRMVTWIRARNDDLAPEEAIKKLRQTTILAAVISAIYITWSLVLDGYGGPEESGHVALFVAITVIGCIFCLMHLPQAAIVLMIVVTVPYLIYYVGKGQDVYVAIALNIFLVCLVILQVLFNGYRGFCQLVKTQKETERLNAENEHLAQTDALTGLPNRRYFFSFLQKQLEKHAAEERVFTVGIIDLDRFKPVNDTYGHKVGDDLLTDVGDRLKTLCQDGFHICRLGGDEFGFVHSGDPVDAEAIAQTLCENIREPYQLGDISVTIGASCGIASYPDAGATSHTLFDRADYALYTSKQVARGRVTAYSADHEARIRSERAIESALQGADMEKEFNVFFQPIVSLPAKEIIGFEALARWTNPSLGSIFPDQFIPIAEKTGLMQKMTAVLFRKAVRQIAALPGEPCLYFNLSANDITKPETVRKLIATLSENGLSAKRVTFELTETSLVTNYDAAKAGIQTLRGTGAHLAIDDFGTGYSSLSYLHRLPIDYVKVDKSFISGIGDPAAEGVIHSILSFCRSMKIYCVIEGVETEAQVPLLNNLDCRLAQGYHFARPQSFEALQDSLCKTGLISDLPLAKGFNKDTLLAANA